MGALNGTNHCPPPTGGLDAMREFANHITPQVGVVLGGLHGDAGAVHPEHHQRRQRTGTSAVASVGIDTHHVQLRVHVHPLALGVEALVGDLAIAHVGVERPIAGESPHVG